MEVMKLKLNTPTGIASYPHLTNPDDFMGKLSYKCDLRLDSNDPAVQELSGKIEAFATKAKEAILAEATEVLEGLDATAKAPAAQKKYAEALAVIEKINTSFRVPLADEWVDDEQTGNVLLKCKSNASFQFKQKDGTKKTVDLAPKFFGLDAKVMTDRPDIKGGAKLKLQVELVSYSANSSIGAGITCRINGVQIIQLGGGGSNDDCGFSVAEGYEAPDTGGFDNESEEDDSRGVY